MTEVLSMRTYRHRPSTAGKGWLWPLCLWRRYKTLCYTTGGNGTLCSYTSRVCNLLGGQWVSGRAAVTPRGKEESLHEEMKLAVFATSGKHGPSKTIDHDSRRHVDNDDSSSRTTTKGTQNSTLAPSHDAQSNAICCTPTVRRGRPYLSAQFWVGPKMPLPERAHHIW